MNKNKKQIYQIIDTIASEYGWKADYILKLPSDIILNLIEEIQNRKQEEYNILTQLMAISVSCGFSGKMKPIRDLFKKKDEQISEEELQNQLRVLWGEMKRDPKILEEQIKKGNVII